MYAKTVKERAVATDGELVRRIRRISVVGAVVAVLSSLLFAGPALAACPTFPPDNAWNTEVDQLPVHARSADYASRIGASANVHADFGSGVWPPGSTSPIGIPYVEVDSGQPDVTVNWTAYGSESDPGPYPIPADAPIEGGPSATGDRHVIVVDTDDCMLYELFYAFPAGGGTWNASNGAKYDMTSNALRPDGWTSADAAGLPIYPGLVRYEEVLAGEITHAIRFTAPSTQRAYVWPARHFASSITDPTYPPMGQRFRLKASFDISGFSSDTQVILRAMQTYGIILADNGSPWFISGAPDDRWNNSVLHELHQVHGSDYEAVDASSLMVDPDSGQVSNYGDPLVTVVGGPAAVGGQVMADLFTLVGATERISGANRYATAAALSAASFSPGPAWAVVATGERHPDALAAAPVAAGLGAPILLVQHGSIPGDTASELSRLGPANILVVGGTGAVSNTVAADLAAYTSGSVARLSGLDRYQTAAAVSAWHFPSGVPVAFLADGIGFADALAAGAAAAELGGPVLLTDPGTLPAATRAELLRLQPAAVVVVGGPGAISTAVEQSVDALGSWTVTRVAGSNRYGTAAAISAYGFGSAPHVYLTTGRRFPDALAAAAVAGAGGAPVLLVQPDALPGIVAGELVRVLEI
jgi:putative cell wall-binding protein